MKVVVNDNKNLFECQGGGWEGGGNPSPVDGRRHHRDRFNLFTRFSRGAISAHNFVRLSARGDPIALRSTCHVSMLFRSNLYFTRYLLSITYLMILSLPASIIIYQSIYLPIINPLIFQYIF